MKNIYTNLNQKELRSAVIGMTLGDSNIQLHGLNARIQIAHTSRFRDYMNIKSTILCQIPGLKCSITDAIQKNRKLDKEYLTIRLRTSTHPFLTEIRQRMYQPTKHINEGLLKEITPLGLALWYMDDGHLALHYNVARSVADLSRTRQERSIGARNIKLNTQSFNKEENEFICKWMKLQWEIDAKIKEEKKMFLVYLNTKNARKFVDIVRPYVFGVPSMWYKIDFKYKRVTQELMRFNIEHLHKHTEKEKENV